MNLYNLKYFVDAAKHNSMTKAAEINNLSRPAISQAIQKLEEELGVTLVDHKRRSFELTPSGLALLKKSDALFSQIDEIHHDLKAAVNGLLFGDFKIGTTRTLATFNLSYVMKELKTKHHQIDFKIHLANSGKLIEMLARKELDLAYFIGDEPINDYKHIVISKGYFCLIAPKNNSNTNLQFAISERRPETERLKTLFERQFLKPLPIFAEVQSWDAIWTWVNSGICGGLVPDFLLHPKSHVEKNFKVILPKVFPYEIKAVFAKGKQENLIIKDFLQYSKN